MRFSHVCLTALVALGLVVARARATTVVPWTTADTSYFTSNSGASWADNTLSLSYPVFAYSAIDYPTSFVLPQDVIGVSFDVSGTLPESRATVTVSTWTGPPSWNNVGYNMVGNEFEIIYGPEPYGQYRWGDLTDWTFTECPPQQFEELPETTSNGTTSVEFYFTYNLLQESYHTVRFAADGVQIGGEHLAGTTTFSNVSWITGESPPGPGYVIPEPLTMLGVLFGVGGVGTYLRRRYST